MVSPDLNSEPTENLIEYIQWKDQRDYAEIAKEAFRVFTFRFQLDLQKKLIPICTNWGYDKQVASEIAYETFSRIWKYPKFDVSKSNQKDYNKAIQYFKVLASQKDLFANSGKFYQAITLLQQSSVNRKEAEVLLQEVIDNNLEGKEEALKIVKQLN